MPDFSDEFDGDTLDAAKWIDHNPNWRGRQPAFFSPRNVTVEDGKLRLAARVEDPPEELKQAGYHTYSTASVRSRERVLYGYFEVRAKPMRSILTNAFWFYCDDRNGRAVRNDLWHQPLHMLFDVETMDGDGLPPRDSLPLFYEIDYVRSWRRME